jgi:hypothetical protein
VPERVSAPRALGKSVVWLRALPLFQAIARQDEEDEHAAV